MRKLEGRPFLKEDELQIIAWEEDRYKIDRRNICLCLYLAGGRLSFSEVYNNSKVSIPSLGKAFNELIDLGVIFLDGDEVVLTEQGARNILINRFRLFKPDLNRVWMYTQVAPVVGGADDGGDAGLFRNLDEEKLPKSYRIK